MKHGQFVYIPPLDIPCGPWGVSL